MIKIIPVIDLKDGVVVHAKQGNRNQYQPINTSLCQTSNIIDVIHAFLSVYDFSDFYIADLNALCNQGNHDILMTHVLTCFPDKSFWIDSGYRQPAVLKTHQHYNYLPVLGSESYDVETIAQIKSEQIEFVLSLDYALAGELGSKCLFSNPDYWPNSVIVMTLARVGSNNGPNIQLLQDYCLKFNGKNFIAAGGIRHLQDLHDLENIGIKQALVASALHSGAINGKDIAELQNP